MTESSGSVSSLRIDAQIIIIINREAIMAGTAARLMNNVIKQHLHHVTHADASYDQTSPVNFIAAFRHAAHTDPTFVFLLIPEHEPGKASLLGPDEPDSSADRRHRDHSDGAGADLDRGLAPSYFVLALEIPPGVGADVLLVPLARVRPDNAGVVDLWAPEKVWQLTFIFDVLVKRDSVSGDTINNTEADVR